MKFKYTTFFIAAAVVILLIGLAWFNYFVKNDSVGTDYNQTSSQEQSQTFFAEAALPVEKIYQNGLNSLQGEFLDDLQQPMQPADMATVENLRQKVLALHVPLSAQSYHFSLVVAADILKGELAKDKISQDSLLKAQSNLSSLLSGGPLLK
ncbi:MAG: hypothetical protein ACOZAJ_03495 [Patescibacteria group bacterium]